MARYRNRTALTVLAVLAAAFVSGCGGMGNRMQRIPVTSVPPGALITVDGRPGGETPVTIWLSRNDKGHVIRIECPGYNPVEIRPERAPSGRTYLGNLLLGAAVALPIAVYQSLTDHDDHFMAMTVGFGGLFALVDLGLKTDRVFRPKELNVTLTKVSGEPRVAVLLIDAALMQDINWIRVRR